MGLGVVSTYMVALDKMKDFDVGSSVASCQRVLSSWRPAPLEFANANMARGREVRNLTVHFAAVAGMVVVFCFVLTGVGTFRKRFHLSTTPKKRH